jgi:hypothetical protein
MAKRSGGVRSRDTMPFGRNRTVCGLDMFV